jgi:6-phosphogluconolactonase
MKTLTGPVSRRFWLCAFPVALWIGLAAGPARAEPAADGGRFLVYVGTYTGGKSEGVYVFRLDAASGKTTAPELAAKTENPSFLAISPDRRFLYAAGETGGGTVSAFAIDAATGKLAFLNRESSEGAGPCHLVVDRQGKNVLVANYGDGTAASLPITEGGRLGKARSRVAHSGSSADAQRQKGPHAHSINLDPAGRFAVVADLGIDRLMVYRFSPESGELALKDPGGVPLKPGAGPRHFAFAPGGRFAYAINEMHCTVTAFAYDGEGGLRELQTLSTLPGEKEKGYSTAEVQVHPSGKFVYGSNRGHDTIAVFKVEGEKGTLALIENQSTRGKTPRNFGIDPTGRWLLAANQGSDTVHVFAIDGETGRLKPAGEAITVPSPVCVKFVPAP